MALIDKSGCVKMIFDTPTLVAREKEQVMRYIINQKEHHHKLTAREELILILNEAGIEFDERFL